MLNVVAVAAFDLAFECLLILQLAVTSAQKNLGKISEEATKKRNPGGFQGIIPSLHAKLGISAEKLLRHKWVDESTDNKGLKNKVCPLVSNLMNITIYSNAQYSQCV